MTKEIWKPLIHNQIEDGYYLSTYGRIRYKDNEPYDPTYPSSNGYNYSLFILRYEGNDIPHHQLFPIDELLGLTFIPIPDELKDKQIKIIHIDGNNRNDHISNLQWIEDIEEWRFLKYKVLNNNHEYELIELPEYKLSNHCRLWSFVTNDILTPNYDNGYIKYHIRISKGGRSICAKLHRAMAITFDLPGYTEYEKNIINHINGVGYNDRLKNLEWVSNKDNTTHAFMTGLEINPKGESHPRAKFTDKQRLCIYDIIKTLKYVPPSILAFLIAERLPEISIDDIKYAKQIIKKTENFVFPILPPYNKKYVMSQGDIDDIRQIILNIFDEYNITHTEVYLNEYKKDNKR